MALANMPDHILIDIFKKMPVKSRLQLSATCSKLRQLLFYPTLWMNFDLETEPKNKADDAECAESLLLFFSRVPENSLTSIIWKFDIELFEVLHVICNKNSRLRFLQIVDEEIANEHVQLLCESLLNLAHLGITGSTKITGECLQYFQNLPFLTSIDLSYSNKITDDDFCRFLNGFKTNQLIAANLDNVSALEDKSISLLLSKHSGSLINLNFDGENNSDAIFKEIAKCQKLQSLTVNFASDFSDIALRTLPPAQEFQELCLRKGQSFTEIGIAEFLARGNFSELRVLNLSECGNLSNSCAVLIGAHCPNLTHLYLCWCWEVGDAGILTIVTRCQKMVEMDLTGLHMLTGNPFLLIPDTMPFLEKLKLEMCHNVQDEILNMVVAKMEGKLVIINCDYEHIQLAKNGDEEGEGENDGDEPGTSFWSFGDVTEENITQEEASSSSSEASGNSNESSEASSSRSEQDVTEENSPQDVTRSSSQDTATTEEEEEEN